MCFFKTYSMYRFRRKLYTRGSSFETTIPMPILFSINKEKKHDVIFVYDQEKGKWYIELEEDSERTADNDLIE